MNWTDGGQMVMMMAVGIYSLDSWALFSQNAVVDL